VSVALLAIPALALAAYQGWSLSKYRRLTTSGVNTSARVVAATAERGGRRSSPRYWVTYEFSPENGQTYRGRDAVMLAQKDSWDRVTAAGEVTVRYLTADPSVNCWDLAIPERSSVATVWLLVGLAVAAGSLFAAAFFAKMTPEQISRWWNSEWHSS
jgi:hypothetical protein